MYFLLLFPCIFVFSSILTLFPNWKYYKRVYDSLDVKNFKPAYNAEYNYIESSNGDILWFANDNAFKLSSSPLVYIHNSWVTRFDPYSIYWWWRYKKWFNENCSHLKK